MQIVGIDIFGDVGTGGAPSLPLDDAGYTGPTRVKNDRIEVFSSTDIDTPQSTLLPKGEAVTITRVLTSTGATKAPIAEIRYKGGVMGYTRTRNLEGAAPSFVITDKPSTMLWDKEDYAAIGLPALLGALLGGFLSKNTALGAFIGTGVGGVAGIGIQYARGRMGGTK